MGANLGKGGSTGGSYAEKNDMGAVMYEAQRTLNFSAMIGAG
jgi:hypothetical protein